MYVGLYTCVCVHVCLCAVPGCGPCGRVGAVQVDLAAIPSFEALLGLLVGIAGSSAKRTTVEVRLLCFSHLDHTPYASPERGLSRTAR